MYVTSKNEPTWVAEVEDLESTRYTYRICKVYGDKFKKDGEFAASIIGERIPATEEQIKHIEACIKANKFVSFNKEMMSPNYEIY